MRDNLFHSIFRPSATVPALAHKMTAALLLILCTACQETDEGQGTPPSPSAQYINITVSVSNGTRSLTRNPLGGEDGDGREAGFERESTVSRITIILADKALGETDARIQFVKTSSVTPVKIPAGTDLSSHGAERQYTTGDLPVRSEELDLSADKDYHVIVVANNDIALPAKKGDALSTALQDATLGTLFTGNAYSPDDCQDFVMSSEEDVTVNFTNTDTDVSIERSRIPDTKFYSLRKPIHIERLAARIEYDSGGAAYDTEHKGFKYADINTASDYFILESIVPFNLYGEEEYLFKHVTTSWPSGTVTYLGDETTTNYVVDPKTSVKETTALTYVNALTNNWTGNSYLRTAESLNGQKSKKGNNHIIAYARENTLLPTSPLGTYATGLAITGSIYSSSGTFKQRNTYYGYLRHQGESSSSYKAYKWSSLPKGAPASSSPAMNYGIVRNNIYCVSISKINYTSDDPTPPMPPDPTSSGWIELKVAVHDWREVTHPNIYI